MSMRNSSRSFQKGSRYMKGSRFKKSCARVAFLGLIILSYMYASVSLNILHFRASLVSKNIYDSDPINLEGDSGPLSDPRPLSRRKFVSYTSSPWELAWVNNIEKWVKGRMICKRIFSQADTMHRFINLVCTSWAPPPYSHWCIIDDGYVPLWYDSSNTSAFKLQVERPIPDHVQIPPPTPIRPTVNEEDIFSKFTFLDEITGETYTEYIEPLVSVLRFPLAKCMGPYDLVTFRGYILPPPALSRERHHDIFYFDAGASSWDEGDGGPSLKYFVDMWGRHGISFDEIYAFEVQTTVNDFYKTVPEEYKNTTHYYQTAISSSRETASRSNPFMPDFIKETAQRPNAYKMLKLDIDSPKVEDNTILHYLNSTDAPFVDEILWEHHCDAYIFKLEWGKDRDGTRMKMHESYQLFLDLRLKGIRAHSWI